MTFDLTLFHYDAAKNPPRIHTVTAKSEAAARMVGRKLLASRGAGWGMKVSVAS